MRLQAFPAARHEEQRGVLYFGYEALQLIRPRSQDAHLVLRECQSRHRHGDEGKEKEEKKKNTVVAGHYAVSELAYFTHLKVHVGAAVDVKAPGADLRPLPIAVQSHPLQQLLRFFVLHRTSVREKKSELKQRENERERGNDTVHLMWCSRRPSGRTDIPRGLFFAEDDLRRFF